FGVTPTDASTFVAIATLMGLVALAAVYVPARRAAIVDPLIALQHEQASELVCFVSARSPCAVSRRASIEHGIGSLRCDSVRAEVNCTVGEDGEASTGQPRRPRGSPCRRSRDRAPLPAG